jgi:hypothetical protein
MLGRSSLLFVSLPFLSINHVLCAESEPFQIDHLLYAESRPFETGHLLCTKSELQQTSSIYRHPKAPREEHLASEYNCMVARHRVQFTNRLEKRTSCLQRKECKSRLSHYLMDQSVSRWHACRIQLSNAIAAGLATTGWSTAWRLKHNRNAAAETAADGSECSGSSAIVARTVSMSSSDLQVETRHTEAFYCCSSCSSCLFR